MAPLPRVCIAPTHILYVLGARLLHPPTHTIIAHVSTMYPQLLSGLPEAQK